MTKKNTDIRKKPNDLNDPAIGQRIREHRKRMDLTQDELSQHLLCTTNYLGQMERGRNISFSFAKRACEFFGVSFDYLLYGKEYDRQASILRESPVYQTTPDLIRLLETCTSNELDYCEDLVRTALTHLRSFRDRPEET